MFTLFRIAFGRHETIPDRASLHTQKWLGGGGGGGVCKKKKIFAIPLDL